MSAYDPKGGPNPGSAKQCGRWQRTISPERAPPLACRAAPPRVRVHLAQLAWTRPYAVPGVCQPTAELHIPPNLSQDVVRGAALFLRNRLGIGLLRISLCRCFDG